MKNISLYELLQLKNIKVIENITDSLVTGEVLGDLILVPGNALFYNNGNFTLQNLNDWEIQANVKGSFVFKGTNLKYFNHLFNSIVLGKYYANNIYIDRPYYGSISYIFLKIIKNSINLGV